MIEEVYPCELPTFTTRGISNEEVDRNKRYSQIIEVLSKHPEGMTAKEIAVEMYHNHMSYSAERNISAPRLNELMNMDRVVVIGKKKCSYSGKSVSVFKLKEAQ